MSQVTLLDQLVTELISKHKCHAVLLYGSRARGDATEHSDYDLMGIKKSGEKFRIARKQRQSFGWLKQNDSVTFRLFKKALARPLESTTLKKLVERVSGVVP